MIALRSGGFVSSDLERFSPRRLVVQGPLSTIRWTFRSATCSIDLYWFAPPQLQRGPARSSCPWRHRFSLTVVGGFGSRGHVFSVIGGCVADRMRQLVRGPGRWPDLDLRRAGRGRSVAVRRPALRRFQRHRDTGGRGDQPGRHGDRPPPRPRHTEPPWPRQLRLLNAGARSRGQPRRSVAIGAEAKPSAGRTDKPVQRASGGHSLAGACRSACYELVAPTDSAGVSAEERTWHLERWTLWSRCRM